MKDEIQETAKTKLEYSIHFYIQQVQTAFLPLDDYLLISPLYFFQENFTMAKICNTGGRWNVSSFKTAQVFFLKTRRDLVELQIAISETKALMYDFHCDSLYNYEVKPKVVVS